MVAMPCLEDGQRSGGTKMLTWAHCGQCWSDVADADAFIVLVW